MHMQITEKNLKQCVKSLSWSGNFKDIITQNISTLLDRMDVHISQKAVCLLRKAVNTFRFGFFNIIFLLYGTQIMKIQSNQQNHLK